MHSTILPEGQEALLPNLPTDGQEFIDSQLVRWIYNRSLDLWERNGTVDVIPLATSTSSGLMSSADKVVLDKLPSVGGGFGLIVDTKYVLKNESNPDGIIKGDIKLKSDSLDIVCVGPNQLKLKCSVPPTIDCAYTTSSAPGLMFKVNENFLSTFIVDIPGCGGKDGLPGDDGPIGEPGWSDGPKGITGLSGKSSTQLATLTGIDYNDIPGLTDTAIVGLNMVDSGNGCTLRVTTGKVGKEGPADKIIASPIRRLLQYQVQDGTDCKLTNLDQWTIVKPDGDDTPLNLMLLRLAKGSNADGEPVSFNGYYLSKFVEDIVSEYKKRLLALDVKWGMEVKNYIQTIDSKARQIISELANQLSMCEFALPAVEYCITLIPCDKETPPPPPPPPPPSPAAVAAGRAGAFDLMPARVGGPAINVNLGHRVWRTK